MQKHKVSKKGIWKRQAWSHGAVRKMQDEAMRAIPEENCAISQWSPVMREENTETENGSSRNQLHIPHFSQCPVNQKKFHRMRTSFTADNTTVWVAVKG